MITAVNSCGCPPKFTAPPVVLAPSIPSYSSPPCTPKTRNPSKTTARKPFENPKQISPQFSKQDDANCPCPRPGHPNYECMQGKCSPCCTGVFPQSKVVSKIVEGGKPYKEIEAIINDNHMVIRIQREPVKSKWDPPCDCAESNIGDNRRAGRLGGGGCESGLPRRCGNNVVFQKVDNFNDQGCDSGGVQSCRTVTVFPQPEVIASESRDDDNEKKEKKEKLEKSGVARLQDLEENPNIFVLRIRKRSENSERKNNIDLEFRTPRPWINKPKPTPQISSSKPAVPAPATAPNQKSKKGKAKGAGKKKKGKK